MGAALLKYYDDANALGGMKGAMRLAMLTKMSSKKAGDEPDTSDNIKLFQGAINELKKEFK